MHSLEQLRSGALTGITRLDLSAELSEFPAEIFQLADSLEVLNLSGNRLTHLPHDLSRLHKLKVLFCSDNPFSELPEVLGECPQLEMVGFKANRIEQVPEAALPPQLRWLILTDNRITSLPRQLGERARLQKLMLAGNRLQQLPESMADLANLELLRIAANRIDSLPEWLLRLPRLAWLAFAGNPGSNASEAEALASHPLPAIARDQVTLGEVLGQGASGIIYRAHWQPPGQPARSMAAKLFKGELTSDGLPHSEMAACLAAGEQANLIGVVGPLAAQAGAAEGLLLELIAPHYRPLAGPPSLASCTRDIYSAKRQFTRQQLLNIAQGAAAATAHLHQRGILHGDLYAHNLLVDAAGHCLLGDFGAASFFDPRQSSAPGLQRIEARAFGCLLEELLQRCPQPGLEDLWQLQQRCVAVDPQERPLFAEILARLGD